MSTLVFDYLESFDYRDKKEWMRSHWHWSLYGTGIYLLAIYLGQRYMENRPRYHLRGALAMWNCTLAIFSLAATIRTLPEMIRILVNPNLGFYHSVCSSCEDVSPASAFWAWAFVLSKLVELGDTAFIVLRKQPLIFLHWYHHMTVLVYAWYSYSDYIAPARWFVVMNYLVHSLMYTYYAMKSLKFKIPRFVSMFITTLQLSQMVVGVGVNSYAYTMKNSGVDCDVAYHHLNMGLCMYASYFALFINFFYGAYFSRKTMSKLSFQNHQNYNNNNNEVKLKGQ